MSYFELWSILWNWKKKFSRKEFISTFISPQYNKVLHDMCKIGLLERVGWGMYKVNSPEEISSPKHNIAYGYKLVNESGMKYAFTGPDAVFFWTKGGYQVDRFFGFYPIHLKIENNNLQKWKKFLQSKKIRFYIVGEKIRETLFGVFCVLYPKKNFSSVKVGEYYVDSLKETIDFCKRHIYSYEPALEMLDEMYRLEIGMKYKETKTNV